VSLPPTLSGLERENALLRRQNAQLQSDLIAVQSDLGRLRQQLERLYGRTPVQSPNPLSGGQ
jgi:hypothetical protein